MVDRPRLEQAIALLEATLDATHDAVLVVDLERRIVRWNRQYLRMFGFSAGDLERQPVERVIAAWSHLVEDTTALGASLEAVWSTPEVEALEIIRFKDARVVECFVAPLIIDGRIAGRVASFRDITHSATTEQALEQHRAFLEKAQEVAHIGSWVAELDGSDRLGWSPEAHKIFGLGLADFDGTTEAFFARVHPDDRDAVRAASSAAIAGGPAYDIEHRIVRPDRSVRWVHEKGDILRDGQGRVVRMIGTVQDITERRQLEDQLRQALKMEAIGRLAGGIAHDLNNALTAIAGYAELALSELPDGSARSDVEEILRAAERAGSVTGQLLAFSRKQLLEPRLFDLNDTVSAVGRLLTRLLGADIEVRTELARTVPPVVGDPAQLEQAVINLALNARDAMPGGGRLTLSTSIEEVDDARARASVPMPVGRYLVLRVSDTGHGMSEQTKARIFEPFFTTKEVGKGTGLGLSMVYGTLKQIGGYVFVDSIVGRGTTFRLYFRPAQTHEDVPLGSAAEVSDDRRHGQETVLVVEDESAVRNLVASALRRDGYRLLLAASAEEALAIAAGHREKIDLLLTDAIMPGKSGIDLANALVAARPGLRVMIMSGYTEETLNGLDGQRVELLQKPFTPRELRRRIGEALA